MIVQGEPFGPHYGPVALREPTDEVLHYCHTWGARWARLVMRLGNRGGEPGTPLNRREDG
jgi:hypothetical protein